MRTLVFAVTAVLVAAWCGVGAVAATGTLATDCAKASSELGDPCDLG